MKFETLETEGNLKQLAEKENFEAIKQKAISEAEEVLEVEADQILLKEESESSGGAEYDPVKREIGVTPSERASSYSQAEGIYEEVFHILGFNESHKERHGEPRKIPKERNFWEDCADEFVGSIARWHPEFGFEHSLKRADNELEELSSKSPEDLTHHDNTVAYSTIHHLIGYTLSQSANKQGYDPAEAASMSYSEIRKEFDEEIDLVREELSTDYRLHLDFDKEFVQPIDSQEEKSPTIYIENDSGNLSGYGRYPAEGEKGGAQWYSFSPDNLLHIPTID